VTKIETEVMLYMERHRLEETVHWTERKGMVRHVSRHLTEKMERMDCVMC